MAFYPTINEATILSLNVVVQNLEKDRGYLDNSECPYSDTIKKFFLSSSRGGQEGKKKEVEDLFALSDGEEDIDKIEKQVKTIINDLEDFGRKLDVSDSTDKMGYFRTKTALVDKLLGMRERVYNIKEINDFKMTLLGFMDEVLTKDQITDFMKRLDGILGTKNDNI